jgi:hypothetical protein
MDDAVLKEGGVADELEVEDWGWSGGEKDLEGDGVVGEDGF